METMHTENFAPIDHAPTWKYEVRGHNCAGLDCFMEVAGGCVPSISKEGIIYGCDDSNPILIDYCPWCGTKL